MTALFAGRSPIIIRHYAECKSRPKIFFGKLYFCLGQTESEFINTIREVH